MHVNKHICIDIHTHIYIHTLWYISGIPHKWHMYTQTLSHSLSSIALEQLHKSLTLILVTENIKRIPFQQKSNE